MVRFKDIAGDDNELGTLDDQAFTLTDGGAAFTLSSGAEVSLSGDVLTYNLEGTGAYDDLLIGETALDVIGYEVSDGNGGTANGQIDATIKGSLNTLETIEASLPTGPITFSVVDELESDPPANSNAFTLTITGSDDARLNGLVIEDAYCLAIDENLITGVELEGNVFLADADSVPVGALDQIGGFGNAARDNLDLINWILNQDFGSQDNGDGLGETYTDAEIQGAIWGLTDNFIFLGGPEVGTVDNAIEIALEAQANGEGFVAGEGDIVGLFIDPTLATEQNPGHAQPFIIGVPFSDLAEECIC